MASQRLTIRQVCVCLHIQCEYCPLVMRGRHPYQEAFLTLKFLLRNSLLPNLQYCTIVLTLIVVFPFVYKYMYLFFPKSQISGTGSVSPGVNSKRSQECQEKKLEVEKTSLSVSQGSLIRTTSKSSTNSGLLKTKKKS